MFDGQIIDSEALKGSLTFVELMHCAKSAASLYAKALRLLFHAQIILQLPDYSAGVAVCITLGVGESMRKPSATQAIEALLVACLVPASAAAAVLLNPILGVWIAAVGLAHGLLLAAPLYVLLERWGWVNVFTSVVAGFLVGGLPAALLFADLPGQYIPFAAFGATSGALFWAYLWWQGRKSRAPETCA